MKCIFDVDRKAFYLVPTSAQDRLIINTVFDMQTAGDFVLLVRQDVIGSDGVISHLEVSRFLYNPPRALSAYERANPNGSDDPRGGLGTKRSAELATRLRRQAIQTFIAGLSPAVGDVVALPAGTNPIDPDLTVAAGTVVAKK